jgi:branched-chain amino acid transport system permease protein
MSEWTPVSGMRGVRMGSGARMQNSFVYFLDQLINGLTLGSIYGLIAIGYTLVYGIIGMINFAHGEIFMIGAFVSIITFMILGLAGVTWVPLALIIVLIVAMLLTSIYGWSLERVAYRPLRGSPRLAALITAIGMSIFLQNYVQLLQSARNKPMQPVISGGMEIMRQQNYVVSLSFMQMLIIVVTVALMAVFTTMIARSALGRAQRACEQDRDMAALIGVNVDRTISLTFVMGAALASVAGMMFLLYYGVIDFFIGFLAGIKAFTAAVLGGIGSLPGAMLGGILIGLIEAFWSAYFTVEYKDVAAYSILVLVLIFRPTGLLGKPDIEKV